MATSYEIGSFQLGGAGGWSAVEHPEGTFKWSAYGPRGSRHGTAPSQEEATARAKTACEELKR